MLAVLAADWGLLLFRASIALLFGMAALAWPEAVGPLLFAVYTLLDAVAVLTVAAHAQGLPGFGSVLFEGLVRVAGALAVLTIAGGSPLALIACVAVWAALSGVAQMASAVILRREITGEWPLALAALLSLAAAAVLWDMRGGGVRALAWVIGPYSVLFGLALMALAIRLRQLAMDMARL